MTRENYFDSEEENTVHDAYLMLHSPDNEYESLGEIIIHETTLPDSLPESFE